MAFSHHVQASWCVGVAGCFVKDGGRIGITLRTVKDLDAACDTLTHGSPFVIDPSSIGRAACGVISQKSPIRFENTAEGTWEWEKGWNDHGAGYAIREQQTREAS